MSKPKWDYNSGPAFPVPAGSQYYDREGEGAILLGGHPGQSLRQYYAGQVIIGAINNKGKCPPKGLAVYAVQVADALIAELEKGSE